MANRKQPYQSAAKPYGYQRPRSTMHHMPTRACHLTALLACMVIFALELLDSLLDEVDTVAPPLAMSCTLAIEPTEQKAGCRISEQEYKRERYPCGVCHVIYRHVYRMVIATPDAMPIT